MIFYVAETACIERASAPRVPGGRTLGGAIVIVIALPRFRGRGRAVGRRLKLDCPRRPDPISEQFARSSRREAQPSNGVSRMSALHRRSGGAGSLHAADAVNSPAAAISRRSHSGATSKPFGRVGAPKSRNARRNPIPRAAARASAPARAPSPKSRGRPRSRR